MTVQLAGAAILPLKVKATTVADEFDVGYKRVIGIPEKEPELWEGLITLKHGVSDPNCSSTRDNSLRCVIRFWSQMIRSSLAIAMLLRQRKRSKRLFQLG